MRNFDVTSIIYLASSGHSGSTALGSLLGTSPRIAMLGELGRIREVIASKRCSCRLPLLECPQWGEVWRHRQRWLRKRFLGREFIENHRLFDQVRHHETKPMLLDTSKNARRLKVLHQQRVSPRVIWLKRNGLAVINSQLVKRNLAPEPDTVDRLAQRWAREQSEIRALLSDTGLPHIEVNLEALSGENTSLWGELENFLTIDKLDLDTTIDPRTQHQLDGNSIRKGASFVFSSPGANQPQLFEQLSAAKIGSPFWAEMDAAGYS